MNATVQKLIGIVIMVYGAVVAWQNLSWFAMYGFYVGDPYSTLIYLASVLGQVIVVLTGAYAAISPDTGWRITPSYIVGAFIALGGMAGLLWSSFWILFAAAWGGWSSVDAFYLINLPGCFIVSFAGGYMIRAKYLASRRV